MTCWRLQLHPSESSVVVKHTVVSLAAHFIGLDFSSDVGDLTQTTLDALPGGAALEPIPRPLVGVDRRASDLGVHEAIRWAAIGGDANGWPPLGHQRA